MLKAGRGRWAAAGGLLALVLLGTGAWCVGQAVLLDGVAALGTDSYTVLPPRGDRGCALVVHEQVTLRASSGAVYAVGPWGLAEPVGSWRADEIELPVRDGTYSLRWSGGAAELALHGDHAAMPDLIPLRCDR